MVSSRSDLQYFRLRRPNTWASHYVHHRGEGGKRLHDVFDALVARPETGPESMYAVEGLEGVSVQINPEKGSLVFYHPRGIAGVMNLTRPNMILTATLDKGKLGNRFNFDRRLRRGFNLDTVVKPIETAIQEGRLNLQA